MTVSEFETLRGDVAAMRAELDARLTRVETKLDEKPGAPTVYQVAFGAPIALVGVSAASVGLARAFGPI